MIIRVLYPENAGIKLMRIYEIAEGQTLAVNKACSKVMQEDWDTLVASSGGVEQDVIDGFGINDIQDMR